MFFQVQNREIQVIVHFGFWKSSLVFGPNKFNIVLKKNWTEFVLHIHMCPCPSSNISDNLLATRHRYQSSCLPLLSNPSSTPSRSWMVPSPTTRRWNATPPWTCMWFHHNPCPRASSTSVSKQVHVSTYKWFTIRLSPAATVWWESCVIWVRLMSV